MKKLLYIILLTFGCHLTANAQINSSIYRFDDMGSGLKSNETFENLLASMGPLSLKDTQFLRFLEPFKFHS